MLVQLIPAGKIALADHPTTTPAATIIATPDTTRKTKHFCIDHLTGGFNSPFVHPSPRSSGSLSTTVWTKVHLGHS